MLPWLVPNTTLAEFQAEVAPLLAEFEELGLKLENTQLAQLGRARRVPDVGWRRLAEDEELDEEED